MIDTTTFTKREREILEALAANPPRTQQEIALDLGISTRTVRGHISAMLAKSGAPDARGMAVAALHQRMARCGVTRLSRSGRRQAVVVVTPVAPADVAVAIAELGAGNTVYVLSTDVATVLDGLEGT